VVHGPRGTIRVDRSLENAREALALIRQHAAVAPPPSVER
jgi:hypothetical protein